MKSFISALAFAGAASAHCTIWGVSVGGKDLGYGNSQGGYIDTPPNNSPVTDVTSKAMECNVANIKAAKSISINPGDEVAVQWFHNGPGAGDQIIDGSHKGPISVYMSKAGSSMSWTKIAEDGYDGKSWAVTKLRDGAYNGKKGQHTFKMPAVAPGDYVIRPEIIALHEGNRASGAQFYMGCIHVKVGGSASGALPAGVSIPGYVTATTPGVLFNIYNSFSSYPIPGPKVWNGAGTATAADAAPAASPAAPAASPSSAPAAGAPSTEAPSTEAPSGEAPAAEEPEECTDDTTEPAEEPAAPAPAAPAASAPAAAPATGGAEAQKWHQCGGQGYTGATACVSGTTCTKQNDYYHQCI
ncbi:carbohydrate-binding module family 1 protein [Bipolaris oryzae ATCC 44560]|uniref:AA9 family lytic polysaccharide monooxygenase n=1 Tax=Bipolaris oryzae ATCC 44560 TaxID=930090 RepID=W6YW90_COCMI|nr:carbohydrate-binding module family 1 protein [Bipolaris oryzae ATCC 44560]EUC43657.1 carbohydrate-binding module family 1 protein [Bipolaris oryzae ATCC 44560]